MSPKAVDCQGLAGAFTLGTAQADFDVLAKLELPGGFGMSNVIANKSLVNPKLETQVSTWQEWEPYNDVDYVFGNPPCSGFSLLNTASTQKFIHVRNHRGWDSPINDCMWALVEYGARVNQGKGPAYLAMESVQQAYKNGRQLMQMLRTRMEERTGHRYALTHLLVSGSSLGSYQRRHRYYMILTREDSAPFGITVPEPRMPATYWDAISDLVGMNTATWEPQPYVDALWTSPLRNPQGYVDSHVAPGEDGTKHCTQVYALLESGLWKQGDAMVDALRKFYNARGYMPRGFDEERVIRKNWHLGFHQPRRLRWNQQGYVITGSGGYDFIHPDEDRFLTVRECARLQGFPDEWSFRGAGDNPRMAYSWIGKGVPVQAGRWVSEQVRASLMGEQRELVGELIGERERLIDITYAWKGKVSG